MVQKPFQDIRPPSRLARTTVQLGGRSIQDIRRPGRLSLRPLRRPEREPQDPKDIERLGRFPSLLFRRPRLLVIAGSLALLVALFLIVAFFLEHSRITVTPQQQETFVDAAFEASRDAVPGTLSYQVLSFEKTGSEIILATETREVEEHAQGRIVIFNNYDGAVQRLITNTRFETPDGLIYRISEPVNVPGQVVRDGKTIPGSIEVTVYADEPGERYNIGLTDFTIPGFAGSPRFEGFFARSASSMTGGFVGEKRVVDSDTLRETHERLETSLRTELQKEARAQMPDGSVLYEDGMFLSFEQLPEISGDESIEVRVVGTFSGMLFDGSELAALVAQRTLAGYDGEPVVIRDPYALSFTTSNKETADPGMDDVVTFSLSGTARIFWTFNEEALRSDLAGRAKDALPTILSGYPGIVRAEAVLRPFWRSAFPEDPEDIVVRTALDE